MTRQSLSPRNLAEALGVSESSLKRWVDSGRLHAERTPGGHRRIPTHEAIRFIRENRLPLERPERIGLSELIPLTAQRDYRPENRNAQSDGGFADMIFEALRDGHEILARGLVFQCYLDGSDVAAICDGPLCKALHRIGELWQHDASGIVVEHRATDIAIQTLSQLRAFIIPGHNENFPEPPYKAMHVAVGGGPANDPYLIPSLMATCVLGDAGFQAINLGPDTPMASLKNAADRYKAHLVWLSCSATKTSLPSATPLNELAEHLAAHHTPLVVGGRTIPALGSKRHPNVHICRSMAELSAFAHGVKTHSP